MKKNPEAHHYISRRLADTDLYELAKKIEPLAENIGFLPGNYTKFEKQVDYSQLSKKPPDNADTFQVLDLYLVICHNNGVFRQYSWKSIEGVPPFNDFWKLVFLSFSNFPLMDFHLPNSKEKKMRDMSASMGAPWWHYVGAMLIGWAMAALMYTY